MVVPAVCLMAVTVAAAISSSFGLKRRFNLCQFGSKTMKHVLNHVIGPDTQKIFSNFRRQMAISEVPREARQFMGIFVPNLNNRFSSGPDSNPVSIIQLQAVAVS
jgi:hypothetical protein